MQNIVQATKYRDLVVLLLVLDEAEMRARKVSEQFPELEALAESVCQATDLCDMAVTMECMELGPK